MTTKQGTVWASWAFLVAVGAGIAFGALDQYAGSFSVTHRVGLWTIAVSLLSAPWLVFPFVFGLSQQRPGRAALIGLTATTAALLGYFLMIMGPFEGGQWTFTEQEIRGLILSNRENIIGGIVTGPLYGLLGYRWRTRRAWSSALLVAGAICFEPLAEHLDGRVYPGSVSVWTGEIVIGVVLAALFLWGGVAFRRQARWPSRAQS